MVLQLVNFHRQQLNLQIIITIFGTCPQVQHRSLNYYNNKSLNNNSHSLSIIMKPTQPQTSAPPEQLSPHRAPQRRNSVMNIPLQKFAAEQFDEKAIFLCQFCGGQQCSQEDYRTNKIQPNAIEGLHSNWINEHILAMQRPSQRLIKEYKLYDKFAIHKINTILNLQQPGEHPYCGDGLLPIVGFSYDPQGFYSHGITFFNQSWEDMTATTFEHMMRIMNIFHMSIVQLGGKISVHCHAGRGRTLLVICSWLIYYERMSAKDTIDLAVEKRQGVLTRASQRDFLSDFQEELRLRWKSFGTLEAKNFTEFVQNQKVSLLKHEQLSCKFKPYVHTNIMNQLRRRIQLSPDKSKEVLMALIDAHGEYFKDKWNEEHEKQVKQFKISINRHTLFNKKINEVEKVDTRVLTQLLYDFYDGLPFILVSTLGFQSAIGLAEKSKIKENNQSKQEKGATKDNFLLQSLYQPEFVHEAGVQAISVMLDFVYLLKKLIKDNLNLIKQGSQDNRLCDCLFVRLSLLLNSKRKYYPKIFTQKSTQRECRLMAVDPAKLHKYIGKDEVNFANFLRRLAIQISNDVSELDGIITRIRKVDANLHFFTTQDTEGQNEGKKYLKRAEVEQIYDKSRV